MTLLALESGRLEGAKALAYPRKHEGLRWLSLKTSCEEIAVGA